MLHETRDEVTSDDLCGSKSNFMSMPFAKYARMTIVSDSAIAEGLFVLRAPIISFIFIAHYSFMVLRVHSRT